MAPASLSVARACCFWALPGAGKSDLALRLIDEPGCGISGRLLRGELVADDQVVDHPRGGQADGLGSAALAWQTGNPRASALSRLATLPSVALALVVRLQDHSAIERLPDWPDRFDILGVALPLILIDRKHGFSARPASGPRWTG